MQHFKEQNWFAVGLDVIVVIVGIFLGIQVTNWNDSLKDRSDEVAYTQRILDDLKIAQDAAARVLERRLQTFDDLTRAVTVLRSTDKTLSKAECDAIGNSNILNIVVADIPAILELQASGRLGIIRSAEVRRSAVVLHQRIVSLKEVIEQMTSVTHDLYFLFPELVTISSVYNEQLAEFNLSNSCDLEGMRANVKFMNSLSTNLDIYDAYLRDGIRPWKASFEALRQQTVDYLEVIQP